MISSHLAKSTKRKHIGVIKINVLIDIRFLDMHNMMNDDYDRKKGTVLLFTPR